MITPSFGLTATERVLPRLALDWTTGLAQPGVDVTRAGVATFVGSNGLIQSASADTQRIDYSTGTAGLLVEESRTNYCLNSENISAWFRQEVDVLTDQIVSPDGNTTADRLSDKTTTSFHRCFVPYTFSVVLASPYVISFYAKKGSSNFVQLFFTTGFGGAAYANFDLDAGVLGTVGADATAEMYPVGNGWYRCVTTSSATSSTSGSASLAFITSSTSPRAESYTGNNDTLYVWGAQFEAGAFPTSYIPTEATAVTRNADVATMTGTNFSDWFNATEGTFDVSFSSTGATPYAGAFWVSDAVKTSSRGFSCGVNGSTNFGFMRGADGSLKSLSLGSYTAYTTESIVLAYTAANFYGSANASAVSSAAITAFPTSEALSLGYQSTAGGSSYLNGHLKKLSYYKQKVTSPEMQAFSKE